MPAGGGGSSIDVGALFDEYGVRLLAFAHRLLGDRADAEDAVQETFLRAHRQAHTFAAASAPSTWLFAIGRNVCLDRLRTRGSRSFVSLEAIVTRVGEARNSEEPSRDAAAVAEWRWYIDAVREGCLLGTLLCLTVDQRMAFVLRVLCGMDVDDTAAVLGRTPNAVRVLTCRARRALKGFLCEHCSIYDPANRCRCENLVGFSLARGWIGPDDRRILQRSAEDAAGSAAAAIDDVARLAAVYTALPDPRMGHRLAARIRSRLRTLDQSTHPAAKK